MKNKKEPFVILDAMWELKLNIECPKCENYFDYLETDEYKSCGFESLKHCQSDQNAQIAVKCPECKSDLLIKSTSY